MNQNMEMDQQTFEVLAKLFFDKIQQKISAHNARWSKPPTYGDNERVGWYNESRVSIDANIELTDEILSQISSGCKLDYQKPEYTKPN